MRVSVLAGVLCLAMVSVGNAGPASAAVKKYTNIPAEPLGLALKTLAKERQFQVLFRAEVVRDEHTKGAVGELTPEEALKQLLSGTGLSYRYLDANTVTVLSPIPAQSAELAGSQQSKQQANSKEAGKNSSHDFRVAQETRGQGQGSVSVEKQQGATKKKPLLEEVIVTGSRIPTPAGEATQEVKNYSSDQIEQSGQTTLAGFLNTLPEVSTAFTVSPFQQNGQTSVNLRGLPFGTTLVLINGRRVEDTGASAHPFFDLNTIPTMAIERIEIVPEGSSAIYGSDALAGVVNIILKKNFNGLQADLHYGAAADTSEESSGIAWGRSWARGSLSVVGTYYRDTELAGADRSIVADQDHTALGGTDSRFPYCNPGNVRSSDGTNLNGLPASFAAIPPGLSGRPTVQDFAATAGVLNECGYWSQYPIIPATDRAGIIVSGNYEVSSSAELFTELMYEHVRQDLLTTGPILSQPVPASNPFNPFGEDVLVEYQFNSPALRQSSPLATNFLRALAGVRGDLSDSWHWEAAAWEAEDQNSLTQENNSENSAALAAALSSTNPATALNLFTSGEPAPPEILSTFYSTLRDRSLGRTLAANGFVRGPLFTLPAGPVITVLGGEYDRDRYFDHPQGGQLIDFSRRDSAGFAEVRVPLLANELRSGGADLLALSAALRYDNYNDFGGHTTPQFGAEWRPTPTLLIRGAYARAFRAPPLFNVYEARGQVPNYGVSDPRHNGATVPVDYIYGGNPALRPEIGESRSLGAVWLPDRFAGLQVSVTYWRVEQNERISTLAPQTIVDNENLFPDRVIRGPSQNGQPGTILAVDASSINSGELITSGVDFDLSYRYLTRFGEWTPTLSVVDVDKFSAAITPGSVMTNRLSQANDDAWAPRWKGSATLAWKSGAYSASVTGRYVSSYLDYQDTGPTSRELGDFWLWDLSARCEIGKLLASSQGYLSGSYVAVGVVDALNPAVPYSNRDHGVPGYDPSQYDIRGRFVYGNLGIRW